MEKRLDIVVDPRRAETGANAVVAATNRIIVAGDKAVASYTQVTKAFQEFSKVANSLGKGLRTNSLGNMASETKEATAEIKNIQKAVKELNSDLTKLSSVSSSVAGSLNKVNSGTLGAAGQVDKYTSSASKATKQTINLQQAVLGFALTVGGLNLGGMIVDLAKTVDQYSEWQNRLAVVSKGTRDLTQATDELLAVSIKSRTDMSSTMDLYSKLTRVNNQYNLSQEDLLSITETVGKSVAMSGASVSGAQGAVMQFAQALSGNFKSSAQELNSIIEQTPALAGAIAMALGTTTDQLKKMAAEGEISTEAVLNGLLRIKGVIDNQFSQSMLTMGQSWTAVTDAFTNFLGKNEQVNSAAKSIANTIQQAAINFDEYEGIVLAVSAAMTAMATVAIPLLIASLVALTGGLGAFVLAIGAGAAAMTSLIYSLGEYDRQTDTIRAKNEKLEKSYESLSKAIANASLFESTNNIDKYFDDLQKVSAELDAVTTKRDKEANKSWANSDLTGNTLKELNERTEALQKQKSLLEAYYGSSKTRLDSLFVSREKLESAFEKEVETTEKASTAYRDLNATLDSTARINEDYYKTIQKISDADLNDSQRSELVAKAYKKREDALKSLNEKALKPSLKVSKAYASELKQIEAAYSSLIGSTGGITSQTNKLADAYNVLSRYAQATGESQTWVNDQFVTVANSITGVNKEIEKAHKYYNELLGTLDPTTESTLKFEEAQKMLQVVVNDGTISQEKMNDMLEQYKNKLNDTVPMVDRVRQALDDYAKDAGDVSEEAATAMTTGIKSMEDALVDFVTTGKLSFSSLVDSMIADIARMYIKQNLTGNLASMLSGAFSGGSVQNTGSAASSLGYSTSGYAGAFGFAKGGAWSDGVRAYAKGGIPSLSSYSNSVVSKPTMFAAGETFNNLMGEAGAEAILPLERTSSGELGVKTTGSNNSSGVVNNIIIKNEVDGTQATQQSSTTNSTGGQDIEILVTKLVNKAITSGNANKSMKSQFGLSPAGR